VNTSKDMQESGGIHQYSNYGSKCISGHRISGVHPLKQQFTHAVSAARRFWIWNEEKTRSGKGRGDVERVGEGGVDVLPQRDLGLTHRGYGSSPNLFGLVNCNARSAYIDTRLSFVIVVPFFLWG
jgi:hypothetical protein